jgi:2-dehydropantoate 2-reductase
MRIAIFGTGGVGGYFGGRLAQAGEDVVFIARGQHLQAMREHGLRVDSLAGDFVLPSVQAYSDPGDVGPVDAIIVGVKAWQVAAAAEAMQPMVGPDTFIVPLQNGVEAPAVLARVHGRERVLGGLCRIVAYVAGPGLITQAAVEPYVAFGELDNRPSERSERLRDIFNRAQGVIAEIPVDIQVAMWSKFLLISPWSGLGAVTRAPAGVWRSRPETRQLWLQATYEVYNVARARGIALPDDSVERTATFVDALLPHATASMQRDILAGYPSELDSLCGSLVRLGAETGVATPTLTFIYHVLLPQELKARGELQFPGMP